MNKTIGMTAAFLLGAAAGAAGAWYILRERYAQIAQEEIDSVKAVFSRQRHESKQEDISDEAPEKEPNRATDMVKQETESLIEKLDYTTYSKPDISDLAQQVKKEEEMHKDHPYLIAPEEYGEYGDEYELIEMTFYRDKIVADDNMDLVEDVDDVIGFESLNHFEDYEGDSIFVRNDRLKCDYEVILDERTYADALKEDKPYRKGVL